MEGADCILAHRSEEALFVTLTRSPGGRGQWEYTEDLALATRFASCIEAETKANEHHCPRTCYRVRPYEVAHSAWLKAGSMLITL